MFYFHEKVGIIPINFPPIISIGSISFLMEGFSSVDPGVDIGMGEGVGTGEGAGIGIVEGMGTGEDAGIGIFPMPFIALSSAQTTVGSRNRNTSPVYSCMSEKISVVKT